MSYSPHEGSRRRVVNRSTQTDASTQMAVNEDSWLVRGLVLSMRLFLVFFVAFAHAVVIVSRDKIPETLFEQTFSQTTFGDPSLTSGSLDSSEASRTCPPSCTDANISTSAHSFYVVFIGREVGYTRNNTLMASLVQGIPNNNPKKFKSYTEAVQAYTDAVQHGNVRRVQTLFQPSGHVEFISEYMSISAGIRNLDAPHLPSQPLSLATSPPNPLPRTPCNTATCAGPDEDAATSGPLSVSPGRESNDHVEHSGWAVLDARDSGGDTVIIPSASILPTLASDPTSMPGALTVIVLDSEEGSENSPELLNNSVSSLQSAHSSDVYYTDKTYDLAFATYTAEEDNRLNGVEASSSTAVAESE